MEYDIINALIFRKWILVYAYSEGLIFSKKNWKVDLDFSANTVTFYRGK